MNSQIVSAPHLVPVRTTVLVHAIFIHCGDSVVLMLEEPPVNRGELCGEAWCLAFETYPQAVDFALLWGLIPAEYVTRVRGYIFTAELTALETGYVSCSKQILHGFWRCSPAKVH